MLKTPELVVLDMFIRKANIARITTNSGDGNSSLIPHLDVNSRRKCAVYRLSVNCRCNAFATLQ